MKTFILFLFLVLLSGNVGTAQTLKPAFGGTGFQTVQSDAWGNDVLISSGPPVGQMSGVGRPNGEVFVAVPDTTPGFSLRIYKSTDFGATFSLFPTGITPGGLLIPKTKMIRSGLDSIYCSFIYDDTIYVWNVESNNFGVFSTIPAGDYDIVASSTGGLYMYVDDRTNNAIRRYGSADGGVTWPNTGLVTSAGANPNLTMSQSGDTLMLLYYSTIAADTATSSFRAFRYRETALGTLGVTGSSVVIVPAGVRKEQYGAAIYNGRVWIFWTEGSSPNRVVKGVVCSDWSSFTFDPEYTVAGVGGHDNYWFDATIYKFGSGGVDLVYYNDSGSVYNLDYTSNSFGTPQTFGAPLAVNDFETGLTSSTTIPRLVEFYDAGGDVGAIYLGFNTENNLYYDRLSAVSNIHNGNEIAEQYELQQNYPNPFNPSTKINFSIPKDGFTTLKVYDIVGREVATLVANNLQRGSYEVDFNGSQFASGVYFYQLVSNDFVTVKKMILAK